jgi:hypothetical protein
MYFKHTGLMAVLLLSALDHISTTARILSDSTSLTANPQQVRIYLLVSVLVVDTLTSRYTEVSTIYTTITTTVYDSVKGSTVGSLIVGWCMKP